MPDEPSPAPDGASDSLEFLLYSGSYEQVLQRTAAGYAERDARAVIGALSLSGRLDEAESAFSAYAAGSAPSRVPEARFFIVAGLCHSGQVARALRQARSSVGAVFDRQPGQRYWACQGLALVRYFEGRFRAARRFARRALAAAVEASFPYARLLTLDLLAHVSVHLGDIFAGLRLLEQARELAEALGYHANAATLRTASLVFRLRFSLGDVASVLGEVEQLARSTNVSYFTRRNASIELATAFALRGNAERARAALETARSISLPGGDTRGKVRWLVAHALVSALGRGTELARESLAEARLSAGDQMTLQAEIAFVELVFTWPTPAQLEHAERLAIITGAERLNIALDVARGRHLLHPPRIEDRMGRLLLECLQQGPRERALAVLESGFLGLMAWALGRPPARRIIVTEAALISENQGQVHAAAAPLRRSIDLLYAIRTGEKSRAVLLQEVWGIARFVPSRHLPALHTAVSRLRLALGEPDWVLTLADGYALLEGVEVLNWDRGVEPLVSASAAPPPDDRERLLELVAQRGEVRAREVAEALDLSESTALRLLRRLSDESLLVRRGAGRHTRYALR
jgi:DNA-binding transcriptional ArsR family regulator